VPVIFLSYRREDAAGYAGRLRESLEERLGEGRVFRDVDTLEPGQDFVQAIEQRVSQCTAFLALLGREWLEATDAAGHLRLQQPDDYVRREIAAALARPNLLVIPVLVEGVSMPPSTALPEDIRSLTRRHAVSLRDETWSHDVDRLTSAIARAVDRDGGGAPTHRADRGTRPWKKPAALAVFGTLMLTLGILLPRLGGSNAADNTGNGGETSDPAGAARNATIEPGVSYKLDVPAVSEFERNEQIYTLLWASLTARGDTNTLRLRMRFSNEGRAGAYFAASAFRLDLGEERLAPSDGPDVLVSGSTIEHGVITFEIPAREEQGQLRLVEDDSAPLALDLRRAGPLTAADTSDPGDALSRAVISPLPLATPEPLVRNASGEFTLMRATTRRFVNKVLVVFDVRFTNTSPNGYFYGTDDFRLVSDGQTGAPVRGPSELVPVQSSASANFVFEVPPATRQVTLRVLSEGRGAVERSFDIPAR
jgi:hypothetical protein